MPYVFILKSLISMPLQLLYNEFSILGAILSRKNYGTICQLIFGVGLNNILYKHNSRWGEGKEIKIEV